MLFRFSDLKMLRSKVYTSTSCDMKIRLRLNIGFIFWMTNLIVQ